MTDSIGRTMTPEEQLEKWVEGESIHNGETRDKGECCPDFSCCYPKLKADELTRRRYYKAYKEGDQKTVNKMLGIFLGIMVADASNKDVLVIDETDEEAGGLQ